MKKKQPNHKLCVCVCDVASAIVLCVCVLETLNLARDSTFGAGIGETFPLKWDGLNYDQDTRVVVVLVVITWAASARSHHKFIQLAFSLFLI